VQTDEMSIAMKIANLGLTFDTISLTLDDCCYAYSLLALAEGHLTALCNHGQHVQTEFTPKSLLLSQQGVKIQSWLSKPLEGLVYNTPPVPRT
jgi:hypothetical protein